MSAFCRSCGLPWGGDYDWRCDRCGHNSIFVEGESETWGEWKPHLTTEEDFRVAKEVSEMVERTHDDWMDKHGYRA